MICDGKEREQTGKLIEKDMCGTLTRSEYTEFFWCWWWVVLIIMWSLPDCIEVRMGCDQNIFDQMILTSLQIKLVSLEGSFLTAEQYNIVLVLSVMLTCTLLLGKWFSIIFCMFSSIILSQYLHVTVLCEKAPFNRMMRTVWRTVQSTQFLCWSFGWTFSTFDQLIASKIKIMGSENHNYN